MKRTGIWLCIMVFSALLCWIFPLFHVVPLTEVTAARDSVSFNAAEFAADFWKSQLVPGFDQATDAHELCRMLQVDPVAVRQRFGRSVGIGRVFFYFLRGEGTIVAVETAGVAVSCVAPKSRTDLVLKTGLLFGNTIRDATGQLTAGEFSNSQHFNAVATELNRMVEQRVLPVLTGQAEVGRKVRFVGCAEVRANGKATGPLSVVPLHVEFP